MLNYNYDNVGLIQYKYNNHTWLEIRDPVRVTENGQGGFYYAEALMVLPGSRNTAVKCYADISIYTRVNEILDCYMKIVPNNIIAGYRGLYFGRLVRGSGYGYGSYTSLFVTYPYDFRLNANAGTNILTMVSNNQTVIYDIRTSGGDSDKAITVLRRFYDNPGFQGYGSSYYSGDGRVYNWAIGLGASAGDQDETKRYNGSDLTDEWKASSGWFRVGNLEKDFGWSEDKENFDGYIYFCGSAYYDEIYTYSTSAVPRCITIPGLKRLLNYYPWAIRKKTTWKSCNRAEGYLKSREGSSWEDRKNRRN